MVNRAGWTRIPEDRPTRSGSSPLFLFARCEQVQMRMHASHPQHRRAGVQSTTVLLLLATLLTGLAVAPPAMASPGSGLRIVDAAGNTPVVNEGGRIALRLVDGSGNVVSAHSWSTDNKAIGKVKRTNGLLRGKTFGFAAVTAQTRCEIARRGRAIRQYVDSADDAGYLAFRLTTL